MKKLIIPLFCAIASLCATAEECIPSKSIILVARENTKIKPRSGVVLEAVCWFENGQLNFTFNGNSEKMTVRLTDIATGEYATYIVMPSQHSLQVAIGNASVQIDISIPNGDSYYGIFLQ